MKSNGYIGLFNGHDLGQFTGHVIVGVQRPIAEPVENATIEQSGRGRRSITETIGTGIHREDHVQISHHLKKDRVRSVP